MTKARQLSAGLSWFARGIVSPTKRAILCCLLVACAESAMPAGFGNLKLRIKDVEGHPVAGARVKLYLKDRWRVVTTASDKRGSCRFSFLPVGPYRLRIEKKGFRILSDSRDCLRIVGSQTLRQLEILLPRPFKLRLIARCPHLRPNPGTSVILAPRLIEDLGYWR